MVKKKKTREEKVLAEKRHYSYHLDIPSTQVSLPSEKIQKHILTSPVTTITNSYDYVISDLKKTGLITGIILIAQITLYFILNRI